MTTKTISYFPSPFFCFLKKTTTLFSSMNLLFIKLSTAAVFFVLAAFVLN